MLLADLMSGEADLADVAFLLALILAAMAGVLHLVAGPAKVIGACLAFAVALIALGLLAF